MINVSNILIDNFKSLKEFELDFAKFTCLIGLNSSGKSTILQSIDFVSQLMYGNITQWLKDRGWESNALNCKLTKKKIITVVLSFSHNNDKYMWAFNFNPISKKCTYEAITKFTKGWKRVGVVFEVTGSKYMIIRDSDKADKLQGDIIHDYEGSFLSSLKSELLSTVLIELKNYIKNIYSLDLLSPQELRKRSRTGNKLGLSGENLSAFLNTFDEEQKNNLLIQLKKCYKNLDNFDIRKSKGGWSRLEIIEQFDNGKIVNEAKYLNDGILRLIAILSQLQSKKSFLLFDELENGINSELIEFLIDTLIDSDHQVMITTHSPIILNYIEDDTAKKSVHYIYKTKEGFTRSIPFFEIPSMKEKLELMGPGEVYVDTNLTELDKEIYIIEQKKDKK